MADERLGGLDDFGIGHEATDPTLWRVSVLALGDSITRKGPWGALGLPDRSWAWFLAQALGEPLTNLARDGAHAPDVLHEQLPYAGIGHALALVYVGVNDVRAPTWDAGSYAADLDAILAGVAERAPRVLTLTIPADLGRPRAGAKVLDANAIVECTAARHGAVCADLSGLRGRKLLLPDAVHLTPRGQLAVADIAARALDAPLPSEHFPRDRSLSARAHFAWKYGRDLVRI
jgi:GDSL-like Lipase/Acylhydrolase family